jgi:hypothetical protein
LILWHAQSVGDDCAYCTAQIRCGVHRL